MEKIIVAYLEWKGTYARRASINYKIWLYRFLEVCGDKPIEAYSISDIVKFKIYLETHFGSYSVQYAIVVIKNFFQFCTVQGYTCIPSSLIRLPRVNAKSHRAITEKEYHVLIKSFPLNDFQSLRNSIIIRLLWDTGVRVSELCDLDISQLDEQKSSTVISTKKTGKKRIIIWSEETQALLIRYLLLRSELPKHNRTNALFVGWHNVSGWCLRLTSRTIQRVIKHHAVKAGFVEKITPHSFRHGWAHKRRDHNAPLSFIQKGLGHLNPVSTFVYQQYNDNEFELSARKYLRSH